ncbi:MAG TPA: outer membrane beta-barrel protein [Stellaceae bacterium]|nr:outer membrane beta-barrel protein [Stellaceae bacterium]
MYTPVPSWPSGALEPAAVGPEGDTVFNRPRPDYDPLGIRMGSFLVYPTFGLTESFDSNVFATPSATRSDWYTDFLPGMTVTSDWSRNALSASVQGETKHYASLTSENVNNLDTSIEGRYDLGTNEYALLQGIYQLQHEDRDSPDAPGTAKHPIEYHVSGADFAYYRMPSRIGIRVDSVLTSYSFNNGTDSVSGQTINERFRDRIEYVLAPRLIYEIQPGYNAFVRAIGNERNYNSQEPGAGPNGENVRRNSHGWEVDAGGAIAITSLLSSELYVGYQEQDYENPLLKSDTGVAFGGNLLWNVTPLDTIRGQFSQAIAETTLQGASSSIETNLSLTAEHELLRNVLVLGSIGYTHDDYQGVSRTDDTYGANVGARYLLNRNWRATADITYSKRDSTDPTAPYDRVVGTVGVSLGF